MPLVLKDRVKETSTTTGNGTFTLAGAVTGFQSFSVIGNGNTTYYTIQNPGTTEWEVGIGTYTLANTTLARTTILASSNNANAVVFTTGTKDVFVTYPSQYAVVTPESQTFTAAQTFRAANAVRSEVAATQDAVVLSGRAGGVNSFAVTLTPTTLTASRTVTLPDANTTVPVATQTLTFTGPTAARTYTLPDVNSNLAALAVAQTFTATQTFSGSTSSLGTVLTDTAEVTTISAISANGTINYDLTTQSVLYYTSNATANWTVNFRGSSGTNLNTLMSTGQAVTATFLVTQGATAYFGNVVQIDSTTVTPKYLGGTAWTAGSNNSVDIYSYVIIKTGAAAFTVFASQSRFA